MMLREKATEILITGLLDVELLVGEVDAIQEEEDAEVVAVMGEVEVVGEEVVGEVDAIDFVRFYL